MIKILIFGAGEGGRKATEMLNHENVEVLAYVDNDLSKLGHKINEMYIINPNMINNYKYDYILIASMYYDEIYNQLIRLGVEDNKIIKVRLFNSKNSKELMKELFNRNLEYSNIFIKDVLHRVIDRYFICDMDNFDSNRNLEFHKFEDCVIGGVDYVRVSTVELISREIQENAIEGSVAELGVYRGDFTRVLSAYFNNKKLYLFDTFEGFDQKDITIEHRQNYSKATVGRHNDTCIDLVVGKINHGRDVVIKKGYFPDTTDGLEDEIFSFVSIDVDLYKPTYDGLHFFYNRLSKGGYIMIHDYNHRTFTGVKKAVKQFCLEMGITCIPLTDYYGSAIIVK